MDNAGVNVSPRGNYIFRLLFNAGHRWIIMIDRMRMDEKTIASILSRNCVYIYIEVEIDVVTFKICSKIDLNSSSHL